MADKDAKKKRPMEKLFPEEAVEHVKKARTELRKSIQAFMPPEFVTHRRAARVEMLKAMRVVVDSAIEHIEAKE
jgi:hypothetical protein